jgi:hypothetical protein
MMRGMPSGCRNLRHHAVLMNHAVGVRHRLSVPGEAPARVRDCRRAQGDIFGASAATRKYGAGPSVPAAGKVQSPGGYRPHPAWCHRED